MQSDPRFGATHVQNGQPASESSTSVTCPVLERDCPTPRKLGRGRSRAEVVSELGCAPHPINAEAIGAWAMDNNR